MSDFDALARAYHSEQGWYPVKEAVADMLEEAQKFTLSQFQQQVVRDVLVKHRNRNDSFCLAYDECKFRIPFGSAPQMRELFAQHQVDEIIKALS